MVPRAQKIGNEPEEEDEVDMLMCNSPCIREATAHANARADYEHEGDGSLADQTAQKARKLCSARCRLSFIILSCFCVFILLIVCVALGMELQGYFRQYLMGSRSKNTPLDDGLPNEKPTPSPLKKSKVKARAELPAKPHQGIPFNPNQGASGYAHVKGTFGGKQGAPGTNAHAAVGAPPAWPPDTQGTLLSSDLKCKPTAIRGEHTEKHRQEDHNQMTCKKLELTFDDGGKVERYNSNTQYCWGGYKGSEPGGWLYAYHEAIVAWAVLHPVRARANESIFLDIGANAGIFSALAASEGFEVISFEPQPMCADNVLHMKMTNHIRRWKVFNVGVGCRSDNLMVFGDSCGMNWQNDPYTGKNHPRNYQVPQVPLSSFKFGHGTAPPFFKVDVDGGELEVAKAILDLARNGKFPQLPEMYFEMNPGYWPKLNGCNLCAPCLGKAEPKLKGPNGCWGRLLNEGEQVFTDLSKMYKEIFLFGVLNGPCEERNGVKQYLRLHKIVSSQRKQYIYRVLDFPAVMAICVHLPIEHLGEGQMNVWFTEPA